MPRLLHVTYLSLMMLQCAGSITAAEQTAILGQRAMKYIVD